MFTSQSNDQKFVKSLEKEIMKFLKPNPKSSNNGSFITSPGSNGLSSLGSRGNPRGPSSTGQSVSSTRPSSTTGPSSTGQSVSSTGTPGGPSSTGKSVSSSSSSGNLRERTSTGDPELGFTEYVNKDVTKDVTEYVNKDVTILSSDIVNVLNQFSDIIVTRSLTDGKGNKINYSRCDFGDNDPEGNCSGNDNTNPNPNPNPNDTNKWLVTELGKILDSTDENDQGKKIDDFTENIKNNIVDHDNTLKTDLEELKNKSNKNGADILVKIISAIIKKLFSYN